MTFLLQMGKLGHRKEEETCLNSRDSAVSISHTDFEFMKCSLCFQTAREGMEKSYRIGQNHNKTQRGEWSLGKIYSLLLKVKSQ